MVTSHQITSQPQLSEVSRHGLEIYDTALRSVLEPEFNGQVVAIDVQSGDHAVADTSPAAMRALRQRRPQAVLLIRTIGPETRHGLVARVLEAPLPSDAAG